MSTVSLRGDCRIVNSWSSENVLPIICNEVSSCYVYNESWLRVCEETVQMSEMCWDMIMKVWAVLMQRNILPILIVSYQEIVNNRAISSPHLRNQAYAVWNRPLLQAFHNILQVFHKILYVFASSSKPLASITLIKANVASFLKSGNIYPRLFLCNGLQSISLLVFCYAIYQEVLLFCKFLGIFLYNYP